MKITEIDFDGLEKFKPKIIKDAFRKAVKAIDNKNPIFIKAIKISGIKGLMNFISFDSYKEGDKSVVISVGYNKIKIVISCDDVVTWG